MCNSREGAKQYLIKVVKIHWQESMSFNNFSYQCKVNKKCLSLDFVLNRKEQKGGWFRDMWNF